MQTGKLTYDFDEARVRQAFPESAQFPDLLKRFGNWAADKPWGSIGHFYFDACWSDRYFNGAECHYDKFALFMALPEGSAIGFWLGSKDPDFRPIVLLEFYGAHAILASSLEEFLARIALSKLPEDFLVTELPPREDADNEEPDLRAELAQFLENETGIAELEAIAPKTLPSSREFLQWVAQEDDKFSGELANHPSMQAISEILQIYHSDAGFRTTIWICWAGDLFGAAITSGGLGPQIREADLIKPHLEILRREAAARTPGLGLWHSAALMVLDGRVFYLTRYMEPAQSPRVTPGPADYKADQAKAPREQRRIPAWLLSELNK